MMEDVRKRVEDPAVANGASRELQAMIAEESLCLASILHMHR